MSTTRRPAGLALLALATLALAWPISAWGAATGEREDARDAARLVTRTRKAASDHDFTGRATVSWNAGARTARVGVAAADGAIEITSEDGVVIDEDRRTYLRDPRSAPGWTSVLVEPTARGLPGPGSRWDLSTETGRSVAGRPTTLVVAVRRDGTPAQRLFVDDETGLLLGREVLGPNGRVERSVLFSAIEIGATGAGVDAPRVASESAPRLSSVPSGYRAPASVAGYQLVTRSRHPDGVLLFYTDGLFSVSVFEQQGDLNWGALPEGGTAGEIAGTRTRVYREPSGNVLVWGRDGLVYTCVSDAPSDVFRAMIDGFVGAGRSTSQSIVDFVLGPFGWN